MATAYFLMIDGGRVGPVDEEELHARVQAGQANTETPVWHQGLPTWQPLGAVIGICHTSAQTAAPAPLGGLTGGADNLGAAMDRLLDWDADQPKAPARPPVPRHDGGFSLPDFGELAAGFARPQWSGLTRPFNSGGFFIRLLAMILDFFGAVLLATGMVTVLGALGLLGQQEARETAQTLAHARHGQPGMGVGLALFLLYYVVPVYYWGGTPGKLLLGLRVVRPDGEPCRFVRIFAREFIKTLPLGLYLPFGFYPPWIEAIRMAVTLFTILTVLGVMSVIFTEDKRAFHDYLCDTLVGKTGY